MNGRGSQLSEVKNALLELKDVRARLNELKRSRNEPIAIIGLGGRFPGNCHDPESYWRLLHNGEDTVREIPASRWDIDAYYDPDPNVQGKMYTRYGSFLEDVDLFDAQFFGISPREAASMDPQHRILLEVSWEALEHAGQSPARLKGSQTGVFIGITNNDYARLLESAGVERVDAYHLTGTPLNFASGRLSYTLGLHGPCLAVDTACSSSLVAVHLACQSLRSGECELALAGGVNLVLSAAGYVIACRARMMAHDGRCKTFDARADGFVRGEGCGVVVLKRLSDAVAARDNILAVIRGSAVNQDGYSSGLTVPNKSAQEAVIRRALDFAAVPPAAVGYVEAHGTGTALGDPIELRALSAVLGSGRSESEPFAVGSVKTNIGHLEAAAGVAGLIKTVLALQNQEIPPHLHFQQPNANLDWAALPIVIPTSPTPWMRGAVPRIASVSSFGGSGTNAHAVLEEAPLPEAFVSQSERPLHILTLSAKTPAALEDLVVRYDHFLAASPAAFADICYTANTGRAHLPHRLAVVAGSVAEARLQLATAGRSHAETRMAPPAIAFVSTGTEHGMTITPRDAADMWRSWGLIAVDSAAGAEAVVQLPADDPWTPMLGCLAEFYRRGAEIDWEAFDRSYARRKVVAPRYPFQRKRFWIDTPNSEAHAPFTGPNSHAGPHPVLGHRLESALSEIVFERVVAADSPSLLADHRVYGALVVPGAYHLSLLLSAAREILPGVAHQLRDVTFSRALVIPEGKSRRLQVILRRQPTGGATFQIFSSDPAADPSSWTLHAEGEIQALADAAPGPVPLRGEGELAESELFYHLLWDAGIHLGNSFCWVEQVWYRAAEALGRMRLPAAPDESRGFVLPPGLIDSCFQVLAAALAGEGIGSAVYLPVGIKAFRLWAPIPERLWCSARLSPQLSQGGETHTGSLQLLDENGAVIADIENLSVKRAPREVLLRTGNNQGSGWLYQLEWQSIPRAAGSTEAARLGPWLIVSDYHGIGEQVARLIREGGGACLLGFPDPSDLEAHRRLVAEACAAFAGGVHGVLHLAAIDDQDPLSPTGCAGVLHLVQGVAAVCSQRPPRLYFVTKGVQAAPGDTAPVTLAAAPVWGLGRVIASEHPELRSSLIDLDVSETPFAAAAQLYDEVARGDIEDQIALRTGGRFAARLARAAASVGVSSEDPLQLDITSRGTLENLQYRPTSRRRPGPNEIEIQVHATGLNLRDVLNALGMYPGNPGPFGGECAGVVVAVGEQVKDFSPGDEVVAIAPGAFATFVTTPAPLVSLKPREMTFADAASLPMAFLTADYALNTLAGMTSADRVLIHAAAGGVGMAAVRLAQACGAEIFATAGSEAKRDFLRSLGIRHVLDSRSVVFASEIHSLTGGRGVDIVLNSLAGEFIPKSLEIVAAGGRFLEIGKREIWPAARMRAVRPDVIYHAIALDRMILEEPVRLGALFRSVMDRIQVGSVQPIPVRAFPVAEVQSAFRHMALARHIGKIVVTQVNERLRFDGTYLITGGFGALGLRVAEWMARSGAGHIVLTGRHEPSPAASARI